MRHNRNLPERREPGISVLVSSNLCCQRTELLAPSEGPVELTMTIDSTPGYFIE